MRSRSQLSLVAALGLVGLLGFHARVAAADGSCSQDSDCVKGWSCQVTGGSGCAVAPCPPGEKCDPVPDCAPQEYKSCVPGPCSADSDCATGMVCYHATETVCSTTPCSSDGECADAGGCETRTTSACVPRYMLPCTAAADCGSGFSCVLDQPVCKCSGGGSTGTASGSGTSSGSSGSSSGSADGGSATPPNSATPAPAPSEPAPVEPAPECDCAPATTSSCHVNPVTCSADSDCATGWTCQSIAQDTPCASTTEPAPAPGSAPPPKPALPSDCAAAEPAPKQCVPPYFSLVGSGTLGTGRDGSANSGEKAGTANGTPTSGDNSALPVAPHEASDQTSSAGCALAAGSQGSAAAGGLLFGLGLFAVLRRRRALAATR